MEDAPRSNDVSPPTGQSSDNHYSVIDVVGFAAMAFALGWAVSEARSRRIVGAAVDRWLGVSADGGTETQPPTLKQLVSKLDKIGELATRDATTAVSNRQRILDDLDLAVAAASKSGAWLALCMVDINGFKEVNDTFGHAAGDAVLLAMAERMAAQLNEGERLGRIGGDEFLIILPRHDSREADARGEAIRATIAASPVILTDARAVPVTGSIGTAATYGRRCEVESLRSAADQAMYLAKSEGGVRARAYGFDQAKNIWFPVDAGAMPG